MRLGRTLAEWMLPAAEGSYNGMIRPAEGSYDQMLPAAEGTSSRDPLMYQRCIGRANKRC